MMLRSEWLQSYCYSSWVCFLPAIAHCFRHNLEMNGPSLSNFQAIPSELCVELCVVCEEFVTNRVVFDETCK